MYFITSSTRQKCSIQLQGYLVTKYNLKGQSFGKINTDLLLGYSDPALMICVLNSHSEKFALGMMWRSYDCTSRPWTCEVSCKIPQASGTRSPLNDFTVCIQNNNTAYVCLAVKGDRPLVWLISLLLVRFLNSSFWGCDHYVGLQCLLLNFLFVTMK